MKVHLSSEAKSDLIDIGDRIGQDNPARADSFVQELLDKAEALSFMPRAFPLVPRFERLGIRRRVHGKYLILYMVSNDVITIVRIVHAARDYDRLLLPDE